MPEHDNRGLEPGAEFDLLVRSSLETYADPGPDSGLAERVLARVAAEGARERTRRAKQTHGVIRWAIALPVAACLIVAIVLAGLKTPHNSPDHIDQARVTTPRSTDTGRGGPNAIPPSITARRDEALRPPRHSSRTAAAARVQRLPKLDVFPAPQPLTPAEQALIAYVAHAPNAERQSLVDAQKRLDAPLTIAALEIKPLEPPEPGGN
jgi:hypothetical protein